MLDLAFWLLFLLIAAGLGIFLFASEEDKSVVSLVAVFSALGGVFALMGYTFLGGIYVLLYAGAVVVAFLMVAWLVSGRSREGRSIKWAFFLIFISLGTELSLIFLGSRSVFRRVSTSVSALGELFLGKYLYVFELTSLLILTAVVSSLVLMRRRS